MKYSYYLVPLYLLFSTYCYSQHYQIKDKYRGDPFFRKINMNKLEKDCTYPLDYWQLDNTKQKEIDKLCPLNYLKFDFTSLHKFIYQGPLVIYNGKDFQLTLSMPVNEDEHDIDPETILGREISLSIVKDNIVEDKIYLANNFMSIGELSVAYQRYYISQQGDIYTLYLAEADDGIYL